MLTMPEIKITYDDVSNEGARIGRSSLGRETSFEMRERLKGLSDVELTKSSNVESLDPFARADKRIFLKLIEAALINLLNRQVRYLAENEEVEVKPNPDRSVAGVVFERG